MKKRSQPTGHADAPDSLTPVSALLNRRSFLGRGTVTGLTALLPIGALMAPAKAAFAGDNPAGNGHRLTEGDVAILRFLAAAELIEADLWQQYNELANGNPDYMTALQVLDGDMPSYATQNTVDEQSHANFLNAFLLSERAHPVNLDAFRTLSGSKATGAAHIGRLTNLMNLNVDTSWYTRYRSAGNPDFGDTFPQVVDIINRPAIPLRDGYTPNQIQAIANTAGFHFGTIEQGGASLYDAMSVKVSSLTALRIVTSIGGAEVAHFEVWHDKAGNAPAVDSGDGLVFPNLSANPNTIPNQIMPRPCKFLSAALPLCSVIRPTSLPLAGAKAAISALTASGLFIGQSKEFFKVMKRLANEADEAERGRED